MDLCDEKIVDLKQKYDTFCTVKIGGLPLLVNIFEAKVLTPFSSAENPGKSI